MVAIVFVREPTDTKNGIRTIVGDGTVADFRPILTLSRWQGEVSFKVGHDLAGIALGQRTFSLIDGNKATLDTPLLKFQLYELPSGKGMEDGGQEFAITLKTKPPVNSLSLPIETSGLDFFYQPPLTQAEIDHNIIRPDNVVGSYAVYHSTKRNDYSLRGGKNYKAGKAFHIYRPKATDSLGTWIWCDLNINTGAGKMTITVPQVFLNSATYPIIIDPDFGYTGTGATNNGCSGNQLWIPGAVAVLGETGIMASYSAVCRYDWDSSVTLQIGCYNTDATPDLQDHTGNSAALAGTMTLRTINSVHTPTLNAGNYWLAINTSGGGYIAADTGAPANCKWQSVTYGTWPDPMGTMTDPGYGNFYYTLYGTYATGGEEQAVAGAVAGTGAATGIAKIQKEYIGTSAAVGELTGLPKIQKKFIGSFAGLGEPTGLPKILKKMILITVGSLIYNNAGFAGRSKLLRKFIGTSTSAGDTSGSAKIQKELIASSAATSNLSGLAKQLRELIGSLAGATVISGPIKLLRKIVGSFSGVSSFSAILKKFKKLVGSLAAQLKIGHWG